jgi:hypothetical protein
MHQLPSIELAVKINAIINQHKEKLKDYQNNRGQIDINLIIGLVLGGICSFAETPALNQILRIFFPVFNENQISDYANFMMGLNNYLVFTLDTNPNNIYLLDGNKWVLISDADFDCVYALWYAFFGIMKVEFKTANAKINNLKTNNIANEALRDYEVINKIMLAPSLTVEEMSVMQNKFPIYARRFNELRKLMYQHVETSQPTIH